MSHTPRDDNVDAFTQGRPFFWRALFMRPADTARTWRRRQRQRREPIHYLETDRGAASDLGIDRSTAREWADRPFWRA